jgi:hypothetical protein
MGVTIHFDGQLLDIDAFGNLITTAAAFATSHMWLTEPIESRQVTLLRVRDNEEPWDYSGPVRGLVLYPSEDCDPMRLEFDRDLYLQEFTKTQFAGVETHLQVLELLRAIEPFFRKLRVEDEGEYWETGDVQILTEHMKRTEQVIEDEKRKNPSAQVKVKTPEGRIMDLMT